MSTTPKPFAEAIKKIREAVNGFFNEEPAATDMAPADALKDYTTDAGALVKIDKLDVGGKVFQSDGTTPLAGDIVLADGTMVSIDETGTITAVTIPEPIEQAVVPPAPVAPGIPVAQFEEIKAEFAAFKAQLPTILAELKAEKEARTKDREAFSAINTQVLDLFQKFADEPSGDPAQAPADKTPQPNAAQRRKNIVQIARESVEGN